MRIIGNWTSEIAQKSNHLFFKFEPLGGSRGNAHHGGFANGKESALMGASIYALG